MPNDINDLLNDTETLRFNRIRKELKRYLIKNSKLPAKQPLSLKRLKKWKRKKELI